MNESLFLLSAITFINIQNLKQKKTREKISISWLVLTQNSPISSAVPSLKFHLFALPHHLYTTTTWPPQHKRSTNNSLLICQRIVLIRFCFVLDWQICLVEPWNDVNFASSFLATKTHQQNLEEIWNTLGCS